MQQIFTEFGFSQSETNLYLTLLEFGPSNPTRLTKRLEIPRTTLYGLLENLARHGLVTASEKNQAKIWQAERPEKIIELLNQKQQALELKKNELSQQLPILNALSKNSFNFPRFYYYEGVSGVQQIMRDLLLYRNIETLAFWPISEMLDVIGSDFMYQHNVQRIRQNIKVRALWPQSKNVAITKYPFLGAGPHFKREIRLAPNSIDCNMSYWIYGNRISFISSQAECFGFIIESSDMRALLQTQFEFFWSISKRIDASNAMTAKFIEDNRLL